MLRPYKSLSPPRSERACHPERRRREGPAFPQMRRTYFGRRRAALPLKGSVLLGPTPRGGGRSGRSSSLEELSHIGRGRGRVGQRREAERLTGEPQQALVLVDAHALIGALRLGAHD